MVLICEYKDKKNSVGFFPTEFFLLKYCYFSIQPMTSPLVTSAP